MLAHSASIVVALVALGIGLAFLSADRRSPASRALALGFAAVGLSIYLNIVVETVWQSGRASPVWTAWFALPEALAVIALLDWILRVRRTVPVRVPLDTRFGDMALRSGQVAALLYGLFSLLWPELRSQAFLRAGTHPQQLASAGFWLFATPMVYAMLSAMVGIGLLLRRRPDRGETIRVLAMALAGPFLIAGLILPADLAAVSVALGEIIFFIGATHYHVLQGQRGQFLARFLSADVVRLVAEQGLRRAMQESQREISIVCCDLRGFTPFAAAQASSQVLQVLREYYDEVGAAVAEHGATIKDFAGDGVLILVGAPLPVPDHARRARELARRIRSGGLALAQRRGDAAHPLGIGIGIATGTVTVGVIGPNSRLEYTAVGSPVNLACRLCEQAQNGEILVDAGTAAQTGGVVLTAREAAPVKGFVGAVPRYALADTNP